MEKCDLLRAYEGAFQGGPIGLVPDGGGAGEAAEVGDEVGLVVVTRFLRDACPGPMRLRVAQAEYVLEAENASEGFRGQAHVLLEEAFEVARAEAGVGGCGVDAIPRLALHLLDGCGQAGACGAGLEAGAQEAGGGEATVCAIGRCVSTTLRHSGMEFREYFRLSFVVC